MYLTMDQTRSRVEILAKSGMPKLRIWEELEGLMKEIQTSELFKRITASNEEMRLYNEQAVASRGTDKIPAYSQKLSNGLDGIDGL
jgi:hypothetical protein